MRALIVDDEPLARQALGRILGRRIDIDTVNFAEDGKAALAVLRSDPHDVVLLDIHMPELSGLQLVDCLAEMGGCPPAVVFVTAFDEHAVAAFEKKAVDYVLKPFNADRVHRAVDSAVQHHRDRHQLAQLLEAIRTAPGSRAGAGCRMALRDKGRTVFINVWDLVSAESEGNYVLLRTQDNTRHLLRETIAGLAAKLAPFGFVRIHRSVLVNGSCIDHLQALPGGDFRLRTTLGSEFNVTRTYRASLKGLAQFWIGVDRDG